MNMIIVIICIPIIFYWFLLRGTAKMVASRRWSLVIVVVGIHLVTWSWLHHTVSVEFSKIVCDRHENALKRTRDELARYRELYREQGEALPAGFAKEYLTRIRPSPRHRVRSFSPLPFSLFTIEEASIGPLNGWGTWNLYVFTGSDVKNIWSIGIWVS